MWALAMIIVLTPSHIKAAQGTKPFTVHIQRNTRNACRRCTVTHTHNHTHTHTHTHTRVHTQPHTHTHHPHVYKPCGASKAVVYQARDAVKDHICSYLSLPW